MFPRRFALVRHVDLTGVSGVGVVAYGVMFADGHVALRWCSDHPATSLWNSIDDLMAVHGHGDSTSVQWIDSAEDRLQEAIDSLNAPQQGRRARRAPRQLNPAAAEEPSPAPPPPPREESPPPDEDSPPPVSVHAAPSIPPETQQRADNTGRDAEREESFLPAQRRTGGRHRRRQEPGEESAHRR
ncbi:hypothetical protein [Phytoactinopolyspora halophila]|uniref:hypothetical protein n=1 Tax=Phytoactinopolyspora halophila TaxID=1981511 RepID=UPI001B8C00F5|nr:hypothetical protein [Phytoactinopolyspora halophila]